MTQNSQQQPTLPELKRFLDRLLSSADVPEVPPMLQEEHHGTAVALGVVTGGAATPQQAALSVAELIERTRACIRLQERPRPADQALETMSAPPAMPDATP